MVTDVDEAYPQLPHFGLDDVAGLVDSCSNTRAMIEDCTALVLAGGDSRRMGRDKAGLLLGVGTLLQQVAASMRKVFP